MKLGHLLQAATFCFALCAGATTALSATPSMISLDENLKKLINTSGDYLLETSETCSPGLMSCYIALQQGADQVNAADLYEALPDLARCILMWGSRANRPEFLGNGAPVGANGCDLSPLLQLLQAIQCSINTIETTISCTAIDDLIVTITNDFASTWTILDEINTTLTTCCSTLETLTTNCAHTPICSAVTITTSGAYCLCRDISGVITIIANDVDLDLNSYTISGGANGILIIPGLQRIKVHNGNINNTTNQGILVGNTVQDIILSDLQITNVSTDSTTPFAIDFQGVIEGGIIDCLIQNVRINNTQSGISLSNANSCKIDNCHIAGCLSTTNTVLGISLTAFGQTPADGNEVTNCTVVDCVSTNFDAAGIYINNASDTLLENNNVTNIAGFFLSSGIQGGIVIGATMKNIVVSEIASTGSIFPCRGIWVDNSTQNTILDCEISGIALDSPTTPTAIGLDVSTNTGFIIENTSVINVGTPAVAAIGFFIGNNFFTLKNCSCENIMGNGFGHGFLISGSRILCQDCSVVGVNGTIAAGYQMLNTSIASLIRCYVDNVIGLNESRGFEVDLSFGYLGLCNAQNINLVPENLGAGPIARGYDIVPTSTEVLFDTCVANDVGEGFNIEGFSTQLQNCTASHTVNGIIIPASVTSATFSVIDQCRTTYCSNIGIAVQSGTASPRITNCYATFNTSNYLSVSNISRAGIDLVGTSSVAYNTSA